MFTFWCDAIQDCIDSIDNLNHASIQDWLDHGAATLQQARISRKEIDDYVCYFFHLLAQSGVWIGLYIILSLIEVRCVVNID